MAERLAVEGRRLSDRLRSLSAPRLVQQVPGRGTRADAGRSAAQLFADLAAGVEARTSPVPPSWRTLPRLHEFAVGDQIAVTCADAVAAVSALADSPEPADALVWVREGRRPAVEVVAEALADLRDLRLVID